MAEQHSPLQSENPLLSPDRPPHQEAALAAHGQAREERHETSSQLARPSSDGPSHMDDNDSSSLFEDSSSSDDEPNMLEVVPGHYLRPGFLTDPMIFNQRFAAESEAAWLKFPRHLMGSLLANFLVVFLWLIFDKFVYLTGTHFKVPVQDILKEELRGPMPLILVGPVPAWMFLSYVLGKSAHHHKILAEPYAPYSLRHPLRPRLKKKPISCLPMKSMALWKIFQLAYYAHLVLGFCCVTLAWFWNRAELMQYKGIDAEDLGMCRWYELCVLKKLGD